MTLDEMAAALRERNPENRPMLLRRMAEIWWPTAEWLLSRPNNHNGGARTGARVAAGFAARLAKRGLLKRTRGDEGEGPVSYRWVAPEPREATTATAEGEALGRGRRVAPVGTARGGRG